MSDQPIPLNAQLSQLIEKARDGNGTAEGELYEILRLTVFNFIRRFLWKRGWRWNPEEIEDTCQNVLLSIYQQLQRSQRIENMIAYLWKATEHALFRTSVEMGRNSDNFLPLIEDVVASGSSQIDSSFDLARYLAPLKRRQIEAIILCCLYGFSRAEAALCLRCSERMIERALLTGRAKIKAARASQSEHSNRKFCPPKSDGEARMADNRVFKIQVALTDRINLLSAQNRSDQKTF